MLLQFLGGDICQPRNPAQSSQLQQHPSVPRYENCINHSWNEQQQYF